MFPTASAMPRVFRSSQNQNLNSGFRFGPVSWNPGSICLVRLQKLPGNSWGNRGEWDFNGDFNGISYEKMKIPSVRSTTLNTHNPDEQRKRGSQLKVF